MKRVGFFTGALAFMVFFNGCRVINVQPYHSVADKERLTVDVITHMHAEGCTDRNDAAGLSVITASDTSTAGAPTSYVLISPTSMNSNPTDISQTSIHLGVPIQKVDAQSLVQRLLSYEADWGQEVSKDQAVFGEWITSIPVQVSFYSDTVVSYRTTLRVNYSKTKAGTAVKVVVSDRQMPWSYSLDDLAEVACLRTRLQAALSTMK